MIGIDVSRWQGKMDWEKAATKADFAFIRASTIDRWTGRLYTDSEFERNSVIGPQYMPCGYYHFFRSKFSAKTQAEHFIELVHDKEGFGHVMDFEMHDPIKSRAQQRAHEFVELIPDKQIIYTRSSLWNTTIGHVDWAENYDLWIARYTTLSHPWGDGRFKPLGWSDWKFWQFSADGNNRGEEFGAESDDIDINEFNGTHEDFLRYIGEAVPEPPKYQINVPANVGEFTIEVKRT
jgi:GH25 family lysozyme M1 (1,4-beta-N-acetylmuramidase)